mgnify:CR=1 FL=1
MALMSCPSCELQAQNIGKARTNILLIVLLTVLLEGAIV